MRIHPPTAMLELMFLVQVKKCAVPSIPTSVAAAKIAIAGQPGDLDGPVPGGPAPCVRRGICASPSAHVVSLRARAPSRPAVVAGAQPIRTSGFGPGIKRASAVLGSRGPSGCNWPCGPLGSLWLIDYYYSLLLIIILFVFHVNSTPYLLHNLHCIQCRSLFRIS